MNKEEFYDMSEQAVFDMYVKKRVAIERIKKKQGTESKFKYPDTFSDFCKRLQKGGIRILFDTKDIATRDKEADQKIKDTLNNQETEYKYINKAMKECLYSKDKCLELIHDIAIDYDGYRDVKNLMELIDEIREIAHYGLSLDMEELADGE